MKLNNNKVFTVVISIWVLITLVRIVFHQPWYDEAHAWSIARELSFIDIIGQMKYEGHTFVWYLLLMPFAKLNLWYPYSMTVMNWLFAFLAVVLMWKRAPLNPVTKSLITFSVPFFVVYPIVARCYAIGVLMLFVLADLYKSRLKHPIIYSLCIFICANTSVMALFGAFVFGLYFAYDLITAALKDEISRKDFRISFIILGLCAVMILWQLGGSNSEYLVSSHDFIKFFTQCYFHSNILTILITAAGMFGMLFVLPAYFYRNKRVLFFYLFNIFSLLFVFVFLYCGYIHHYSFLWVYGIVSFWLMKSSEPVVSRISKISEIFVAVLFFGLIFNSYNTLGDYFSEIPENLAEAIVSDERLKNSRVIMINLFDKNLLPYLYNKNVEFWDFCSNAPVNFDASTGRTPICKADYVDFYPEYVQKVLSNDKENFIIFRNKSLGDVGEAFGYSNKNSYIYLNLYKRVKNVYSIYKITVSDKEITNGN